MPAGDREGLREAVTNVTATIHGFAQDVNSENTDVIPQAAA